MGAPWSWYTQSRSGATSWRTPASANNCFARATLSRVASLAMSQVHDSLELRAQVWPGTASQQRHPGPAQAGGEGMEPKSAGAALGSAHGASAGLLAGPANIMRARRWRSRLETILIAWE
jgi:hypothetical protein